MQGYITEAEPKAYADGVPVHCAHDLIVNVALLKPNPKNPNKHPDSQIQLLGKIIRSTGWRQPITVSKRSGFIVKGHGRLAAALLEGFEEVPVDYQNYTSEAEEYADLVADNRIAELAEIDNKMLADIFAEIDTGEIPMELTGFTEDEVEDLITGLSEALHSELTEPDDVPEAPEPERVLTQAGDLWILGSHRLICGDSTDRQTVEKLMDGQKADLVFTDPPYGNGKSGRYGRGQLGIRTIAGDEDLTVFKKFINAIEFDKIIYFLQWRTLSESLEAIEKKGLRINTVGVWDKKNAGLNGAGGISEQWEAVIFSGKIKYKKFGGNVFNIAREQHKREDSPHPHQKPIKLLLEILDYLDEVETIIDPFGGSGSTLIACEQIGCACYMVEYEPTYCDVIVRRYIKTTGKKDVRLIRQGKEVGREYFERMFTE